MFIVKNRFFVALIIMLPLFILANHASAATTPWLDDASTYGVLSSTFTDTSSSTVVEGSIGYTTPPATAIGGTHPYIGSGAPYSAAGTDQGTVLSDLAIQPCTYIFPSGAIDLSTDTTHGTIGVYTPGVYCSAGAMTIGGVLSLSGSGTFIFRSDGALNSTAGSAVTLAGGASSCNVFWTPTSATTLGANTAFVGTVIDNAGITVGANTTWDGRALAFGGTVTTDTDTITAPSCSDSTGTLRIVKNVINNDGGASSAGSFMLYVKDGGVNVTGSPIAGVAAAGTAYTLAAGNYVVSEDTSSSYTSSFTGACDSSGNVTLTGGADVTCTVTNNDIAVVSSGGGGSAPSVPPLIDLVKVPSPLALPNGSGSVVYTYTVKNIGPVPMTNVTVTDDSCTAPSFVSGDENSDSILDTNETWIYRCSSTLSKTTTNVAVAQGWRYGQSARDTASVTVVVGGTALPPIIHVSKVPSTLLLPVSGNMVTYVEVISNPGTIPLRNVRIADDKCSPVTYISGDINSNSILEPNEFWTYNCRTSLSQTTTNVASVSGEANGITARDFAFATVVVGNTLPMLPNTGIPMENNYIIWTIISIISGVILFGTFYLKTKKN